MNTVRKTQFSITILSLIIIIVYVKFPELEIDTVILTLFIIAIIPWLAPLFKSVELPGGMKFEFQDLKRIESKAKEAGLIINNSIKTNSHYSFLEVINLNPQLALAGLRIELEKALKKLAESNKIKLGQYGMSYLIYELQRKEVISRKEELAFNEMFGVLNKAVHGDELDEKVTQWAISVGIQILDSINKKV